MDFLFPIASIAICGPALAGIIVSRICNSEPKLLDRFSDCVNCLHNCVPR
jgi:hypothetical protein